MKRKKIIKEKIMVAGGTGFLGKRVAKRLQEEGYNSVTTSLSLGVDFRNTKQTENFFQKHKPTVLINCAAFVGGIKFGMEHEAEIFYNNNLINLNLFECARKFKVKRVINPISNCSYPDVVDKEFKEKEWWNGPLHRSVLVYGFVKKGTWVQSMAYRKQYGLEVINLLVPNMYGPGDHFDETRSHALGALIMKISRAKEKKIPQVVVWGSGKPIREWLYVDDCVEAFLQVLKIPSQEEPINLGRGEGISIKELAELIKEKIGYEGNLIYDRSKPDGAPFKIMDIEQMKKIFSWLPPTNIKIGLQKTIEWYYQNMLKKELNQKEKIIKDNKEIIAKIYKDSDWPENLNFYTTDQDFVQVSTWNYNQGKHLKAHGHKIAERKSNQTQEVIFVKSGKMKVQLFSEKNELIYEGIMKKGDFAIIFKGGHAYDILEDKTQILEIKNGPYLGLEKDKKIIEE